MNYLMISNPSFGIRGLPVSTLLCYALITVLNLIAIARSVPERPDYFGLFARPALAAALMSLAAWWSQRALCLLLPAGLATVAAVLLAVLIYALAAVALRAVTREELETLPKGDKLARLLRIR